LIRIAESGCSRPSGSRRQLERNRKRKGMSDQIELYGEN
jgi:hypothetical protein